MTMSLSEIATSFSGVGQVTQVDPIGAGHIHDTYVVQTSGQVRYLLQRINQQVFRDPQQVVHNSAIVTQWISRKLASRGSHDTSRRVLRLVPTNKASWLYESPSGECWRMYHFVEDAHSPGDDPVLEEIFQAAYGFGEFIALLADMPAGRLGETIPHFHHGPYRLEALRQAAARDPAQRRQLVEKEVAFVEQQAALLAQPQQMLERGELPLRVTHNDTKCNNVLLDDESDQALCVIDLDTVMPGLALYDFGDLIRTTVSSAAEDETDLSSVRVERDRLEQAMRGFLSGARGALCAAEMESLSLGPGFMALIMATRFLTDYLNGDLYYKVQRSDHNLDRCRAQISLVRRLLENHDTIVSLLNTEV